MTLQLIKALIINNIYGKILIDIYCLVEEQPDCITLPHNKQKKKSDCLFEVVFSICKHLSSYLFV